MKSCSILRILVFSMQLTILMLMLMLMLMLILMLMLMLMLILILVVFMPMMCCSLTKLLRLSKIDTART
jgi:hypothetical protein